MLFKQKDLALIKSGEIQLAFRKWKGVRAKEGSLIKTSIGELKILSVDEIEENEISEQEAKAAGYQSKEALLEILQKREEGLIYKIALDYHGEDPRIALRNQEEFSTKEFEELKKKLEKMDARSKSGAWTLKILRAIQENPELRAADLAKLTGREKDWLKPNIRKLKNLGLTISLEIGYRISNRGEAYLKRLN
ncbi:MAG: ASCH domain-containing protein [Bacteroidia bacterium]|nr:ASCH domain-containing protein [Bacteroidia bacterium]